MEKEFTCSICTGILYQPLTLLDCLHTFCGSCLKKWFGCQNTDATRYTCPSCRAPVRDTKHNAMLTTLLGVFLAANPDKGKTAEEKEDLAGKYTPGDEVMPMVKQKERSSRERRREDEDRRLIDEVRALSLQEVGLTPAEGRTARRRRHEGRLDVIVSDSSREGRGVEYRERRRRTEGGNTQERRRHRDESSSQSNQFPTEEHRRRRIQEDARRRCEQTARTAVRTIEHQASLQSLVSESDVESRKIDEEIFRQVQEEGLLDGIDIDSINLDQIGERIAEAFRRRQEGMSGNSPRRGSDASPARSMQSESRNISSSESLHVQVRSTTEPTPQSPATVQLPATEEHQHGPNPTTTGRAIVEPPASIDALSPKAPTSVPAPVPLGAIQRFQERLLVPAPPSLATEGATLSSIQRFTEPSLRCARCTKPHIEYDLHYNCSQCQNGKWNICLSCYRAGRGCLNWFGFGSAAWAKWEEIISAGIAPVEPHFLTANRYMPPKVMPGDTNSWRTSTPEDPRKRLQSGTFCANCLAWANECYWRCEYCNEGDWAFCNNCVNQGRCCTHDLLPLVYKPDQKITLALNPTHAGHIPTSATLLIGPGVADFGPFKPLTFREPCEICHQLIQPSSTRYHCFLCKSSTPGSQGGNYNVCTNCYHSLAKKKQISAENGRKGWRRCLNGHRMIIVVFRDIGGAQRRVIVEDLVGGLGLREEPSECQGLQQWSWEEGRQIRLVTTDVSATAPTTFAALHLTATFPPVRGSGMKARALGSWFPKEGRDTELLFPKGAEVKECVVAKAREYVVDANGDWFWGVYMGRKGRFPASYIEGAWI